MNGKIMKVKETLNYLGIIIDNRLSFVAHVKKVREKVSKMGRRLHLVTGKEWGKSKANIKIIYEKAIVPMVIYRAEVWGKRVGNVMVKRQLDAIEEPF